MENTHIAQLYMTAYSWLFTLQAQAIKTDLSNVEKKVSRSVALLKSLSSERTRWESGSETFKAQMDTIIGDCLLSSAFMAYAGYFDQHMRGTLFSTWCHHLTQANVSFRNDLARVEVSASVLLFGPSHFTEKWPLVKWSLLIILNVSW